MLEHITDWLALAVRWLHIIFGAAWIGTSFYFNWLNNNIREPEDGSPSVGDDTIAGELWSVHGGHFYRVVRYGVAPGTLPKTLHWFKYEAYFTFISGFTLLCLVYYADTSIYLIDGSVRVLAPWQGILIGIGSLVGSWIIYDLMCKSPLTKSPPLFAAIGFVLMVGVAFGLTQVFGSRAAYIHVGAIIGTMMAWNVFFVIIPNQKVTVDSMTAGKDVDPALGQAASLRSLHNNYLTLPVLYIMVSNHYPVTFGSKYNWLILAAIALVGAGVRHWFNLHGKGRQNVWLLPAAAAGMIALAFMTAPKTYAGADPVAFEQVREIIENRCITCHSASPTSVAFPQAPQGVMYDTPEEILRYAPRINTQVVVTRVMPLGNMTNITEEERDLIGAWYYQGAPGPTAPATTTPTPEADARPSTDAASDATANEDTDCSFTVPAARPFRNEDDDRGDAKHAGVDPVAVVGQPFTLDGKFAYGTLSRDLEGEYVVAYVQRDGCAFAEEGRALTNGDGRVSIPLAAFEAPGLYAYRIVAPDRSFASGVISVLPEAGEFVVFDVDGTLTTDDRQVFEGLLGIEMNENEGGADVAKHYADQGVAIIYVTARPYWLRATTLAWLNEHGYPRGALRTTALMRSILPGDNSEEFKEAFLTDLTGRLQLNVRAAYGNATSDICAYARAGAPLERTFIIGEHGGAACDGFGASQAITDYPSHLATLQ